MPELLAPSTAMPYKAKRPPRCAALRLGGPRWGPAAPVPAPEHIFGKHFGTCRGLVARLRRWGDLHTSHDSRKDDLPMQS